MSLFGSSPDESTPTPAALKSRNSLFDDDPSPAPGSKSSLFADDDDASGSPWAMPTPKKAARGDLIKNLLPTSAVPDSYIDLFDSLLEENGNGGNVTAAGVTKALSAGNLGADQQSRITQLVTSGAPLRDLSRNEFNVLLALIGLAQEGEDITLDGIDERRRNLPKPSLPGLSTKPKAPIATQARPEPTLQTQSQPQPQPRIEAVLPKTPAPEPIPRRNTLEFPESDPWGSPALHRGHNHNGSTVSGGTSIVADIRSSGPSRTTSEFTTAPRPGSTDSPRPDPTPIAPSSGIWGSYDGAPVEAYNAPGDATLGAGGFGDTEERPIQPTPSRSFGGGRVTGGEEVVQITLLPEKEGMFMLKHHNYQVTSTRRGSKVVRRYSDFVWLLDCLQRRYPFRQIPLLPPKRVGVNGSHLAADNTFIEKRRRGLVRFVNALIKHPVLNQEQLVIMFLTVPTELAVWRKQATISVQEEFLGRTLPPTLEDSLSPSLQDLFDTSRAGIRRSAEIYINLCNLVDRLSKRNEGLAADHLRVSLSLQGLTDASQDTYSTDTNDVPLLNEGLNATAKHLSNSQSLLIDEARAWDQGVLEDLKYQRDSLVSMRDLFDRRDRYDRDNIPQLERRIQNNETKLVSIRAKPAELIKAGEIEKTTDAIIKDKESIVAQHARGVFIKECIRDELVYFQQSQYHISRTHQDWAQERVKYSELQADNWKQLHEELESMPVGE